MINQYRNEEVSEKKRFLCTNVEYLFFNYKVIVECHCTIDVSVLVTHFKCSHHVFQYNIRKIFFIILLLTKLE